MNSISSTSAGAWSRREFLRDSFARLGAAAAGLAWARAPLEAAAARDNPFSLDLERYRRVDPGLVHYEPAGRFRCPRPEPRRLTIGLDDRLYVASGQQVVVLDKDGGLVNELGCTASARSVAVTEDGVYVACQDHVEVFDRKGQRQATWEPVTGRPFLTGLAVGANTLFAADSGNRLIWRFDRSGRVQGRLGERNRDRNVPGLVVPSPYLDVELAPDGLLRVNNPGRHRVEAYTPDGDLESHWGRASAAIDGFCGCCNPVGLALFPDGRCVTFEKGLPRVKVYDAAGTLESVVAGPDAFDESGAGRPEATGDCAMPGGLDGAVDRQGRVYVLDLWTSAIHILQRKAAAPGATPGPKA
jgi:hypothetical protein